MKDTQLKYHHWQTFHDFVRSNGDTQVTLSEKDGLRSGKEGVG